LRSLLGTDAAALAAVEAEWREADAAIVRAAAQLGEQQRARLEALKAEYDAVYEMLSEKIAGSAEQADPNDGEAWRAMQERVEAEQKLLFQRNERTEKARSEARRILGDELAARVRGLVPDEADPAKSRQANRFDFFAQFTRNGLLAFSTHPLGYAFQHGCT
jgi:hypothetical protein